MKAIFIFATNCLATFTFLPKNYLYFMKPYVNSQIAINATPEKVWEALTNPDLTQQYMFGCRVSTSWQPGATIDWVGKTEDGKDITYVTGQVVTCKPHGKLVYTVIDPFATTYPHTPENHLTVTHTLIPQGDATILTASQGNYTKVADGERRYGHGAEEGWLQLLTGIKNLVEAQ